MNFSAAEFAGHEQAGVRPALVLSPAEYNRLTGLALVCPITNQRKGFAWEVPIPENPEVSGVVLADQVRCIDVALLATVFEACPRMSCAVAWERGNRQDVGH